MEQNQEATKSNARSAKRKQPPATVQRQYTAVIELCREAQKHAVKADGYPWRIGNALNDAVGLPGPVGVNDQSGIKMSECFKEVKAEGLGEDYSLAFLKKCRTTSANFPDDKRIAGVPWAVHNLAGNPETLAKMLEKAKDEDKRLTTTFAKEFNQQLRIKKAQQENKNDPDKAYRDCVDKAKNAQTRAKDLVDLASNAETLITPHLPNITERKKLIDAIKAARDEATNVAKAWDKFLQTVSAGAA